MIKAHHKIKSTLLLLSVCMQIAAIGTAQNSERKPFNDIAETSIIVKGEKYLHPQQYRTLQIDKSAINSLLNARWHHLIFQNICCRGDECRTCS
jgi:hypothetical protein